MANKSKLIDLIRRHERARREHTHYTESSVRAVGCFNVLLVSMGGGKLGTYKKKLSLGSVSLFIAMAVWWVIKQRKVKDLANKLPDKFEFMLNLDDDALLSRMDDFDNDV